MYLPMSFISLLKFFYITWLSHVSIFEWLYLCLCLYWCWDSFIYITFKVKKLLLIDLFYNYSITHLNCLCFDSNLSKWFCCWIRYFECLGSLIPVLFACLFLWLQVMLDCRIRNCSLKAPLHLMYKAINLGTYYIRVTKCVWLAWCV